MSLIFNIEINGQKIDIADCITSDADVTLLEYVDEETNTLRLEYEDKVSVTGYAATIFNDLIIDSENPCKPVEIPYCIYDDCCLNDDGSLFEISRGVIDPFSLEWCNDNCDISFGFVQFTEEDELRKCMKEYLPFQDTDFQNQQHPKVPYCVQSTNDADFIIRLIIGSIVLPLLFILVPVVCVIIDIIEGIINFINLLGANLPLGTQIQNFLDNWCDNLDTLGSQLVDLILGCNRKHVAPYLKDILINGANHCNLEFKSTIYNQQSGTEYDEIDSNGNAFNPYYCTMFLFAPVNKGLEYSCDDGLSSPNWNYGNEYNKNIIQILKELEVIHCAEFRVIDGCLYFEKESWFYENLPIVAKDTDFINEVDGNICCTYVDNNTACVCIWEYCKDEMHPVHLETLSSNTEDTIDRYENVVRYCDEGDDIKLRDELETKTFPYSNAAFRNDAAVEDLYCKYSWITFFGGIGGIGLNNGIKRTAKYLVLNVHQVNKPRLLVHDKESKLACATVLCKRADTDQNGNCPSYEFNVPFYLDENAVVQGEQCKTLFSNFLADKGIKNYGCRKAEFTLCFSCDNFKLFKSGDYIEIKGKKALVTERKINITKRRIEVTAVI